MGNWVQAKWETVIQGMGNRCLAIPNSYIVLQWNVYDVHACLGLNRFASLQPAFLITQSRFPFPISHFPCGVSWSTNFTPCLAASYPEI